MALTEIPVIAIIMALTEIPIIAIIIHSTDRNSRNTQIFSFTLIEMVVIKLPAPCRRAGVGSLLTTKKYISAHPKLTISQC